MKKLFDKRQVNQDNNPEFDSFFTEVLQKLPRQSAAIIAKSFNQSKALAEKTIAKSRTQFDSVFADFLVGVDDQKRQQAHNIIHAASLTAAIIGCSPIPFSDAFLLVPVQLTMMARLHKLFGQSWSASLGKSLSKELVLVGLGRSAVGDILKLVPVVGTVTGAAVNATVAMSITEALGWLTVKMLNDGEDIFNDMLSFKNQFKTLFGLLQRK